MMERDFEGCESWHELLHQELDENLPPERGAELAAHLSSCEACRGWRDRLHVVNGGLLQFATGRSANAPSSDTVDRILNRIDTRAAQVPTYRNRTTWWQRFTGDLGVLPIAASAAFACIAIGVWGVLRIGERGGKAPPAATSSEEAPARPTASAGASEHWPLPPQPVSTSTADLGVTLDGSTRSGDLEHPQDNYQRQRQRAAPDQDPGPENLDTMRPPHFRNGSWDDTKRPAQRTVRPKGRER